MKRWIKLTTTVMIVLVITSCGIVNRPPLAPYNPEPADGATDQPLNLTLSWDCEEPDDDYPLTYDVYFGTSKNNLNKISNRQGDESIVRNNLEYSTTYYWKVIPYDSKGKRRDLFDIKIWRFSTSYDEKVYYDWLSWIGKDELGSNFMDLSGEIISFPRNFEEQSISNGAEISLLGEVNNNNKGLELVTWDGEHVKIYDMNLNLINTFTPAGMYRINLLEDIDNDGEYEIGMGCRGTGYVRFYDKNGDIEWEYHEDIGYDGEFDIGKVEKGKVYIMNSAGYSGTYRGVSRVVMETSILDWRFRTGSGVHNVSFYNNLIAFGTNTPHNGWSFNGFDDSHLYHMIVDKEGNLVLGKQVDNTHKNGGVRNYLLFDGYLLGLENHSGYYSGYETLHILDTEGNTLFKKKMRYKNDFLAGLHAAYDENIIIACDGENLYIIDSDEKELLTSSDLNEDDLRLFALARTSNSYVALMGDNNDEQIRIIEIKENDYEKINDIIIDVGFSEITDIIPTYAQNQIIFFVVGEDGIKKFSAF